jgi:hypothetical protein
MMITAIVLLAVGLWMLVSPRTLWRVSEAWKSSSTEGPSGAYLTYARFGGLMLVLAGTAGLIATFL